MTSISRPRLIDSHAHLDFDRFDGDRSTVLERAREMGVEAVITIGTDVASSRRALDIAQTYDTVYASAGIHPHQADQFDDAHWCHLEEMWSQEKVKAVGETGLDYYYDYSDRIRQQSVFERHLDASERLDMPVVIHIRDAFDDAFGLMKQSKAKGVVHCFTGGPEACERALNMGMYISLSGIVTFKNAKALRSAVPMIPEDRLLIETDAPFLAPIPHRGKRNEPAFVVHTAAVVAELRDQSIEHVCQTTRQNTIDLFKLFDA